MGEWMIYDPETGKGPVGGESRKEHSVENVTSLHVIYLELHPSSNASHILQQNDY